MAPKKYQKALSATAQKAALVACIEKRSRACVDNVDIPSVPAQTHNNDLLVIKSWARVLNRGIMGPKGVDTILSSDVTSELSEDNLNSPGYESLSEFDEQDVEMAWWKS